MALEQNRLRSFRVFLAKENFLLPHSFAELQSRISANLQHYQLNYLLVVFFVCLGQGVLYPQYAVFLALSMAAVFAAIFFADVPMRVGQLQLEPAHKFACTGAVVLLLMYALTCTRSVLYSAAIATLLILSHASLHQRSLLTRAGSRLTDFKQALQRDLRELDRSG